MRREVPFAVKFRTDSWCRVKSSSTKQGSSERCRNMSGKGSALTGGFPSRRRSADSHSVRGTGLCRWEPSFSSGGRAGPLYRIVPGAIEKPSLSLSAAFLQSPDPGSSAVPAAPLIGILSMEGLQIWPAILTKAPLAARNSSRRG